MTHSRLPVKLGPLLVLTAAPWLAGAGPAAAPATGLVLNDREYLEMPGLNVMLAQDYYPEGHQGGIGVIQNGRRVATNGDLRLEPTPGQWQPIAKVGVRQVDRATGEISVRMDYPDPARNRRGFNPIEYPDLNFSYTVRVVAAGPAFRVQVDLDRPLPAAWVGKVGFNLELFPGSLFGQPYLMDGRPGQLARQFNGPGERDASGDYQATPLAVGRKLVVAPESDEQRLTIERVAGGDLQLIDGRARHTNGWFVVRSLVPAGASHRAVAWLVTPHALPGWISPPTVQVPQIGYHPGQPKVAVIETDPRDDRRPTAVLFRIAEDGGRAKVLEAAPRQWGAFLRYRYFQFDFSTVTAPGLYEVDYGDARTVAFPISADIFQRNVWQPTLEYFLPIQMCHVRVNDRYQVWHGACHLDDARLAPVNYNHFDGYAQGPATLTAFGPGEHVPGLDQGGWHDAGDDDLRVESQSETVRGLALAYEEFHVDYDETTIDAANRVVELHRPDGKPDVLQQIEHGVRSIAGGYHGLGRLYRGIVEPTLRQYVMLGDPVNATDGKVLEPKGPAPAGGPGAPDDRWVFTEDNPERELQVGAGLAAAARVLRGFNDPMADDCLAIARQLWDRTQEEHPLQRVGLAVELLATTHEGRYRDFLTARTGAIARALVPGPQGPSEEALETSWLAARSLALVPDEAYRREIRVALQALHTAMDRAARQTPYGVPYEPAIWGAGWDIQHFGMQQYYLHVACPEIFSTDQMLSALNFVLGCHPGANTASFVSGVGARSLTVAYGFNRADWTYLPGGIGSGTALIRPDFPELLPWPYLWQQTEYVLGGGTTDYLFVVLAANRVLAAH